MPFSEFLLLLPCSRLLSVCSLFGAQFCTDGTLYVCLLEPFSSFSDILYASFLRTNTYRNRPIVVEKMSNYLSLEGMSTGMFSVPNSVPRSNFAGFV
jgi:hypothetical protein